MAKYINMVMKRFAERKQAIEHNPEPPEKDLRGLKINVTLYLKEAITHG